MKKHSLTKNNNKTPVKYILFIALLTFLIPHPAQAAQLSFTWDPNPPEDKVTEYKLYFGTKSCELNATCDVYNGTSSTKGPSPIDIPLSALSDPNNPSYILDGLDEGMWCFELSAINSVGESAHTPTISKVIDTVNPSISITSPTTLPTYSTTSSSINIGGTASDNICIDSIIWTNDRGGSGTASGTTSWSQNGIALQQGDNVITVTAYDSAGNTATAALTVSYSPPPPDTEVPVITITSPTSSATYETNSSKLNIGGTSADNVEVASVTWVNNRGGSGTASGTTSWSVANITLYEGENIITVTATDTSANTSTDSLTVTYTAPLGTFTEEFGEATNTGHPGTCLDTYINAGSSDANTSSGANLNTYTWPTDTSANRIILKWDLSSIPTSATVQSATLYLYLASTGGDDNYEISAHKIINNNPDISTCTWDTYDGTNSWTGGANGAEQDMAQLEDSQIIDKTTGEYKTWTITNMVADWVANSSSENLGMILESDKSAASNSYRFFSSSDHTDSGQRPKLIITYTTTSDTIITINTPQNTWFNADLVPPSVDVDFYDVDGLDNAWYKVGTNGNWVPIFSGYSASSYINDFTVSVTLDGTYAIYFKVTDDLNNTYQPSSTDTLTIKVDVSPPTGTIDIQ